MRYGDESVYALSASGYDRGGDSMEMIEKYRAAIKEADRVTEEVYESRLAVCQDCEKLNAGTCMACGCYVELRAVAAVSRCPKKKW